MKIDGCLARNIEFEVAARFWGSVGQLVGTFEDVLRDMLILRLLQVSSRFSGFLVASLCLWEKPRNLSFLRGFNRGCPVVLRGATFVMACAKKCRKSFCVTNTLWRGFQKRSAFFLASAELGTCPCAFCAAGAAR